MNASAEKQPPRTRAWPLSSSRVIALVLGAWLALASIDARAVGLSSLLDSFRKEKEDAKVDAEAPETPISILAESAVEPSEEEYPVNVDFEYVVRVRFSGALGAVTVETPETPDLENLEWLDTKVLNRTHPESAEASAEFRYLLRPVKQGDARIGRTRVQYSLGSASDKASMIVEGADVVIGKPLRDWGKIASIAGAALAALLVVGVSIVWILKRTKRAAQVPPPPPSPFEKLRERLGALDRHLIEGDVSAFYGEARDILAAALSQAGLIEGRSLTAREFAHWIEERFPNEERADGERQEFERWHSLFDRSEQVRFAGRTPSADDNRATGKELESALRRLEEMALAANEKETETK